MDSAFLQRRTGKCGMTGVRGYVTGTWRLRKKICFTVLHAIYDLTEIRVEHILCRGANSKK